MSYYDILEVNKNSSPEVIKAAYKSLAQKYHPDKNSSKDAVVKMQELNMAYSILSDLNLRKEYNESLHNFSNSFNNVEPEKQKENADINSQQQKENFIKTKKEVKLNPYKNKIKFLILLFFTGFVGGHRFYFNSWFVGVIICFFSSLLLSLNSKLLGIYLLFLFIVEWVFIIHETNIDSFNLSWYKVIVALIKGIFLMFLFTSILKSEEPNFNEGMKDYMNGNYSQALITFNKLANKNNAKSQFYSGLIYETQYKNYIEARRLYTLAAQQGIVEAQYNLGIIYYNGFGVDKNNVEAIKWYTLASNQGYMNSQFNLATMYEKGEGVTQDYYKAIELYQLAAAQGMQIAQYNLGAIYNRLNNYSEAAKWYKLAANTGYAMAQFQLGMLYVKAKGVPKDDEEAIKLFKLAAEQNYQLAIEALRIINNPN